MSDEAEGKGELILYRPDDGAVEIQLKARFWPSPGPRASSVVAYLATTAAEAATRLTGATP
jgi:hypothetical protein